MAAILFDTEVNSLEHREVIQLAWCQADIKDGSANYGEISVSSYKPEKPIDAACAAMHHIIAEDLEASPPSAEACLPSVDYLIAHNVDFDADVMHSGDDIKRICTLAIAQKLWPSFTAHKLGVVFLELYGQSRETMQAIEAAHDAACDVQILQKILDKIVETTGVKTTDELWEFSEKARVPEYFTFGKHKGEKIADTPSSYSQWLLKQPDIDKYLRIALTERLHGRALL